MASGSAWRVPNAFSEVRPEIDERDRRLGRNCRERRFKVQGSGFRFRVPGSRFPGSAVLGSGFEVPGSRLPAAELGTLNLEPGTLNLEP
jgi:hypothetical protein